MSKGLAIPILGASSLALSALNSKDKAKSFAKDNWKIIIGLAVVAGGGYLVYDKFFKGPPTLTLKKNSNHPPSTLSNEEASLIAEELYTAMKDVASGPDDVYKILSDNNLTYNDFVKVSDQFGKRKYNQLTSGSLFSSWGVNLGLTEWLREDLTTEQFNLIQAYVPNVITTDKTISVGTTVFAKKDNLQVYKAEKIGGSWQIGAPAKVFKKGEEIGKVDYIINDDYEKRQVLIIDRFGFFLDDWLIKDAKDVTAI
jgi:hypothetical protein